MVARADFVPISPFLLFVQGMQFQLLQKCLKIQTSQLKDASLIVKLQQNEIQPWENRSIVGYLSWQPPKNRAS